MHVRRAAVVLLLTLLVPGSAQVAVGNRQLGRIVVRIWLAALATAALVGVLWLIDGGLVLSLLTTSWLLGGLGILMIGWGVIWPLLVVDAWRLGVRPDMTMRARRALALTTVVLVLCTSLPVIGAGRQVSAAGDLIGSVFGADRKSAATDGRYNVLLLGGDAGAKRVGLRPDSITLASVDADSGRTVLISLPRNLENVPFPAGSRAARALPTGWSCGDECLLNGLYTWGSQHKDLFPGVPDAGAEAMKQAVQGVTGLTVNYYVMIDLKGFRTLIDAVGGVKINVRSQVPIGGGGSPVFGQIEPGVQTLNGFDALWYARSRHGSSDYERMARQRCVMDAMAAQLDPATVLKRFQKIAAAGKQVVRTDIPADHLGDFLELGTGAKTQPISSVQFVPPLITPAKPDLAVIRTKVAAAVDDAERPAAKKQDAPAAAPTAAATPAASRSVAAPSVVAPSLSAPAPAAVAPAVPVTASSDIRQECSAAA